MPGTPQDTPSPAPITPTPKDTQAPQTPAVPVPAPMPPASDPTPTPIPGGKPTYSLNQEEYNELQRLRQAEAQRQEGAKIAQLKKEITDQITKDLADKLKAHEDSGDGKSFAATLSLAAEQNSQKRKDQKEMQEDADVRTYRIALLDRNQEVATDMLAKMYGRMRNMKEKESLALQDQVDMALKEQSKFYANLHSLSYGDGGGLLAQELQKQS